MRFSKGDFVVYLPGKRSPYFRYVYIVVGVGDTSAVIRDIVTPRFLETVDVEFLTKAHKPEDLDIIVKAKLEGLI